MLTLALILAGVVAASVGALLYVVNAWRKDLQRLQHVSEDKLISDVRAAQYEADLSDWKVRYIAKDRELRETLSDLVESDRKLANQASTSSVLDTVRERLRTPIAYADDIKTPANAQTLHPSDVTPTFRAKPKGSK